MSDTIKAGLHSNDQDSILDALTDAGKTGRRDLREDVEAFLTSPNEAMREAAIKTLAFYWQLPEHRDTALRLARLSPDEDEGVRAAAVMGLSKYPGEETLRAMLEIALDQNEDDRVRDAAYVAALILSGVSKQDFPMSRRTPGFQQRADWALLARLLREQGAVVPERLAALAKHDASA